MSSPPHHAAGQVPSSSMLAAGDFSSCFPLPGGLLPVSFAMKRLPLGGHSRPPLNAHLQFWPDILVILADSDTQAACLHGKKCPRPRCPPPLPAACSCLRMLHSRMSQ